ncbi:hypothetical protein, partial [Domibacillus epiphyticus]
SPDGRDSVSGSPAVGVSGSGSPADGVSGSDSPAVEHPYISDNENSVPADEKHNPPIDSTPKIIDEEDLDVPIKIYPNIPIDHLHNPKQDLIPKTKNKDGHYISDIPAEDKRKKKPYEGNTLPNNNADNTLNLNKQSDTFNVIKKAENKCKRFSKSLEKIKEAVKATIKNRYEAEHLLNTSLHDLNKHFSGEQNATEEEMIQLLGKISAAFEFIQESDHSAQHKMFIHLMKFLNEKLPACFIAEFIYSSFKTTEDAASFIQILKEAGVETTEIEVYLKEKDIQ